MKRRSARIRAAEHVELLEALRPEIVPDVVGVGDAHDEQVGLVVLAEAERVDGVQGDGERVIHRLGRVPVERALVVVVGAFDVVGKRGAPGAAADALARAIVFGHEALEAARHRQRRPRPGGHGLSWQRGAGVLEPLGERVGIGLRRREAADGGFVPDGDVRRAAAREDGRAILEAHRGDERLAEGVGFHGVAERGGEETLAAAAGDGAVLARGGAEHGKRGVVDDVVPVLVLEPGVGGDAVDARVGARGEGGVPRPGLRAGVRVEGVEAGAVEAAEAAGAEEGRVAVHLHRAHLIEHDEDREPRPRVRRRGERGDDDGGEGEGAHGARTLHRASGGGEPRGAAALRGADGRTSRRRRCARARASDAGAPQRAGTMPSETRIARASAAPRHTRAVTPAACAAATFASRSSRNTAGSPSARARA